MQKNPLNSRRVIDGEVFVNSKLENRISTIDRVNDQSTQNTGSNYLKCFKQKEEMNDFEYHDGYRIVGFIDSIWRKFLGAIPVFGYFFIHRRKPLVRRNSNPRIVVPLEGIFSLRNIFDALTFNWLNYDMPEKFGESEKAKQQAKDNAIAEQTSIGLLAALLCTVWISMLLTGIGNDFNYNLKNPFLYLWFIATMLMASATVFSVIFILALQESETTSEAYHFIKTFDNLTFGLGKMTSLILFYLGGFLGILGFAIYVFSFYDFITGLICLAGTLWLLYFLLIVPLLYMITSLRTARHTQIGIDRHDDESTFYISISQEEIRRKLNSFIELNSPEGIEEIKSEQDFLDFIRKTPYSKNVLSQASELVSRESFVLSSDMSDDPKNFYTANLKPVTELRAKAIYKDAIRQHLLKENIDLEKLDL